MTSSLKLRVNAQATNRKTMADHESRALALLTASIGVGRTSQRVVRKLVP